MVKWSIDDLKTEAMADYIISQGMKGNHLLFDNQQIREAFTLSPEKLFHIGAKRINEIKEALKEIFTIPDMEGKREYIKKLPQELQHIIILLYFQIVEKNIITTKFRTH